MKKFRILACALVVTGFGLTSCSNDDDNDSVNDEVQIEGTYNLTEVNTPVPTDFDENGTSHDNQVEETDCYDDSKIIFNADGTFTYHKHYVLVNGTDGTSACAEGSFTGSWERLSGSGSDALIQAIYETDNGNDVTLNLVKEGNTITFNDVFGSYPTRNEEGGAVNAIGNVEYVFVR